MSQKNRSSQVDEVCSIPELEKESARWVAMGLIDPAQRSRIMALYPPALETPSRFASVIALFGAICLGMGGLLFVASNWEYLPRIVKTLLIVGLATGSAWTGYFLGYKKGNYPKIGESLVLLGSLLWGAGIALVAQIYNIHSPYPTNGAFLWLLGVLPLAWALMSPQVWGLSSIGLILTMGFRQLEYSASRWGAHGFFSASMATALIVLSMGYLGINGRATGAPARVGVITGTFFLLSYSFGSSFRGAQDMWQIMSSDAPAASMNLFLFLIFIACGLGILHLVRGIREKTSWVIAEGSLALVTASSVLLCTSLAGTLDRSLAALIWNLILVGAIVTAIHSGLKRAMPGLVNLGFMFFAIFLFARYFDLFYGLFDRSLFFTGAGLLLILGSAKIERRRKKMLAELRSGDDSDFTYDPHGLYARGHREEGASNE